MSACYVVGMKSGKKKKDGSFYAYLSLLHTDKWGQWEIENVWIKDETQWQSITEEIFLGVAVVLAREIGSDDITACAVNEAIKPIELNAPWGGEAVEGGENDE